MTLQELKQRSERNDASADFELAGRCYNGSSVGEDCGEALRYLRKAADAGHIEAQSELGLA